MDLSHCFNKVSSVVQDGYSLTYPPWTYWVPPHPTPAVLGKMDLGVMDREFCELWCSSVSRRLQGALPGHSFGPCGFLLHPVASDGASVLIS